MCETVSLTVVRASRSLESGVVRESRFAVGQGRVGFRISNVGFRIPSNDLWLAFADSCMTQLEAQRPSRTCNENEEEEEVNWRAGPRARALTPPLLSASFLVSASLFCNEEHENVRFVRRIDS